MQLEHQDPNAALLSPISIPELRSRQQLQERKMCISHIEYPALFLVNVRPVDDNAFQFVQVEGSWFLMLVWISHWAGKGTRTRVNQVGNACRCSNTDTHSK